MGDEKKYQWKLHADVVLKTGTHSHISMNLIDMYTKEEIDKMLTEWTNLVADRYNGNDNVSDAIKIGHAAVKISDTSVISFTADPIVKIGRKD